MEVTPTQLEEVLLIRPTQFGDSRGFFLEVWQEERYREIGIHGDFVQDNLSRSARGTLRGLHYQEPNPQGKLVSVLSGVVQDVVVDIRVGSPTFGKWASVELSAETKDQLWVPPGFAHGFCVLSESADFFYKCTAYYDPKSEHSLRWNDPDLGIQWAVETPKLSDRDQKAKPFRDRSTFPVWKSKA